MIGNAFSSEEARARPTVAMWVLFQVLLSTSTVRFDIADIYEYTPCALGRNGRGVGR